jgi:hypothetical protein
MVRRCGVCRETGRDRRRCPENGIPVVPPENRGRGGGVRGRGRGGQSLPAVPARHHFIQASQLQQHIHEYDFNLDEIFNEAEYDPQPIIEEEDELNFYQNIALEEHKFEQQADFEEGYEEIYAGQPIEILRRLYPDLYWENVSARLAKEG